MEVGGVGDWEGVSDGRGAGVENELVQRTKNIENLPFFKDHPAPQKLKFRYKNRKSSYLLGFLNLST